MTICYTNIYTYTCMYVYIQGCSPSEDAVDHGRRLRVPRGAHATDLYRGIHLGTLYNILYIYDIICYTMLCYTYTPLYIFYTIHILCYTSTTYFKYIIHIDTVYMPYSTYTVCILYRTCVVWCARLILTYHVLYNIIIGYIA